MSDSRLFSFYDPWRTLLMLFCSVHRVSSSGLRPHGAKSYSVATTIAAGILLLAAPLSAQHTMPMPAHSDTTPAMRDTTGMSRGMHRNKRQDKRRRKGRNRSSAMSDSTQGSMPGMAGMQRMKGMKGMQGMEGMRMSPRVS